MWKEKRTELKKYLVNNGFTLPKLGKRHKSTGSENWLKIREPQRNVFHCTSQFNFWIQKQRKSLSTAREKWCVERGIRSQVTPSISIVPCFSVKTLDKNSLKDSSAYLGSSFTDPSSQQRGPGGRSLQQLVVVHLLSGSREQAVPKLSWMSLFHSVQNGWDGAAHIQHASSISVRLIHVPLIDLLGSLSPRWCSIFGSWNEMLTIT